MLYKNKLSIILFSISKLRTYRERCVNIYLQYQFNIGRAPGIRVPQVTLESSQSGGTPSWSRHSCVPTAQTAGREEQKQSCGKRPAYSSANGGKGTPRPLLHRCGSSLTHISGAKGNKAGIC